MTTPGEKFLAQEVAAKVEIIATLLNRQEGLAARLEKVTAVLTVKQQAKLDDAED